MGDSVAQNAEAVYRFTVQARPAPGGKGPSEAQPAALLANAHALGLTSITSIYPQDIYFIEGSLNEAAVFVLARELLSDPISQTVASTRSGAEHPEQSSPGERVIETALRPGVTDPVAEQIVRAASQMGITGVSRAASGQRFTVRGADLSDETLALLANRLLANPVIQRFTFGEIEPVFPEEAGASGRTEEIPLRQMEEAALLELSQQRRAALDLREMLAIRAYFSDENRDMTDVEFETIAQTWSEHCVHKTFKASIAIQNPGDVLLMTGAVRAGR